MAGRLAGALTIASALTAQALLIPPGVTSLDHPVGLLTIANHDWQVIKLPCPDCVIPSSAEANVDESSSDGPAFSILGRSNSLQVNVTTLFDGKAVGLDNYPLYPPLASFNKASVDVVSSVEESDQSRHTVTVSSDTSFVSEEIVAPEGDAVIRIKYHILSVNNHPVTVDSIEVTCLKAADNSVTLISVEPIPTDRTIFDSLPPVVGGSKDRTPPAPKECNMPVLLCQWRDMVEAKLGDIKSSIAKHHGHRRPGCHGRKGKGKGKHIPTHIRPDFVHHNGGNTHRPQGHHGKPPMAQDGDTGFFSHDEGRHWHHRHHGMFHRVVVALAPLAMMVAYFIMGALAGFAVCRLGVIVGCLIVMAWRRFGRGGQRGYQSVNADDVEEVIIVDEAKVEDGLPAYEEEPVPVYEEKDGLIENK